jgi:hypothetical protein
MPVAWGLSSSGTENLGKEFGVRTRNGGYSVNEYFPFRTVTPNHDRKGDALPRETTFFFLLFSSYYLLKIVVTPT